MTYKQLEKIRKEFESLDLNRYRELTLDEMLKVNGGGSCETDETDEESDTFDSENLLSDGTSTETVSETGVDSESSGHEIENSNEVVANAEVGDTLTRDDGTQVTITQGDIDWAQNYCNEHGINWQGEEAEKSPEELQSQDDMGSSESNQFAVENTEINGEKENSQNHTSETDRTSINESSNIIILSSHQTSSTHSILDSFFDLFSGVKDWLDDLFGNKNSSENLTLNNDVYFIYTYKNTTYDQKMKSYERNSIKDDVAWLKEQGISVKVIEYGTKQDILNAIADKDAKIIVTSGHGFSGSAGIQTSDMKTFSPTDLAEVQVGKSLNTVIFENCYQGNLEKDWENAFGNNIDVVGWTGTTTWFETASFNGLSFFDRQDLNLRDYLELSLIESEIDVISGAGKKF